MPSARSWNRSRGPGSIECRRRASSIARPLAATCRHDGLSEIRREPCETRLFASGKQRAPRRTPSGLDQILFQPDLSQPASPADVGRASSDDRRTAELAAGPASSRSRGSTTPPVPACDRPALLESLASVVAACRKCAYLAETRTQTVFGTGPAETRLMFIGEAPGADEDRQGKPFVGRAGQLLTDMITKGMGLSSRRRSTSPMF